MQLSSKLNRRVNEAYAHVRAVIENDRPEQSEEKRLGEQDQPGQEVRADKSIQERLWEEKPEFEKKLGITVSKGAYVILIKELFSEKITT